MALVKGGGWRHLLPIGTAVLLGGLGSLGAIGGGEVGESYDSFVSIVEPAGGNGLAITEIIDQDFGTNDRRGTRRVIPQDFGSPEQFTATSPDAPDQVHTQVGGARVEYRVGDVDTFINGQHRYELAYVLPEAQLDTGVLNLDLISGLDFDVANFEGYVSGFELSNVECFTGPPGSTEPCPAEQIEPNLWHFDVGQLDSSNGVTMRADIVGVGDAVPVPIPELPPRRELPSTWWRGIVLGLVSALTAAWAFTVFSRTGRNEVSGDGAAEAAFGGSQLLPPPGSNMETSIGPTRLVTDKQLAAMATTEFAPPQGIVPWEGQALLDEIVTDATVSAFISTMASAEALTLTEQKSGLAIASGPGLDSAAPADQANIRSLLMAGDPYVADGEYDSKFARGWEHIKADLEQRVDTSGWWKSGFELSDAVAAGTLLGWIVAGGLFLVLSLSDTSGSTGSILRLVLWVGVTVGITGIVASTAYMHLSPSRTAIGSSLALRTESFRRFLAASEAQHVEWAWQNGILREYSAWAVALGEADAWSDALEQANVPESELISSPLMVHGLASSLSESRTQPSSSGGGGGGFSGGGGGGGGGGSW